MEVSKLLKGRTRQVFFTDVLIGSNALPEVKKVIINAVVPEGCRKATIEEFYVNGLKNPVFKKNLHTLNEPYRRDNDGEVHMLHTVAYVEMTRLEKFVNACRSAFRD